MPKLRSLDLSTSVELSGYSLAAIAQLTALTHLSLRSSYTPHMQDVTRLSSLSSLESFCFCFGFRLGFGSGSGQDLQVTCLQ